MFMYTETVCLFKEWKKDSTDFFLTPKIISIDSLRIRKGLQLRNFLYLHQFLTKKFSEIFTR